jgi:hypothetical protein
MRIILTISFICSIFTARSQQFDLDTIYYHGPTANRINLLILGDGYTSSEMNQFHADAQVVADYFFNTPPFSNYREFFNFFTVNVISNESGNDHPATASDEVPGVQPVSSVDNYLESSFDFGGTHRCVYSGQSGLIFNIGNTYAPFYDYITVIVNTAYYGGCGGSIAFTTMHSSSSEIFVHEFGHTFGQLSDEYDYGLIPCSPGTSQAINVSQQTDTSQLVWKKWLTTAPIPTPAGTDCGLVGLYEGANYCTNFWYRPKCDCKMRSLGEAFCEVCAEQLIYKISTMVNYIDSFSPASSVTLCSNDVQEFSVSIVSNLDSTIRIQWYVDSNLVALNSLHFSFDASAYSPGPHNVMAVTYDTTAESKKNLVSYSQQWQVDVFPLPSAAVSTTHSPTICRPDSARIHAQAGAGYTYLWLINDTLLAGHFDSLLDVSAGGNYSVVVSLNGCTDTSSSISFHAYDSPDQSVIFSGNDSVCTGLVHMSVANCACDFQWLNDSVPIAGAGNRNFDASVTGHYSVIITDTVHGCVSESTPVTGYVADFTASISANHQTTICDNDSVTLTAQPPGYFYQWREDGTPLAGQTGQSLVVHLSGDYDAVVSDGLCTDTS